MKNLITSAACIMILLAFVLQFTSDQIMHNKISAVNQAVNNFKEIARQEGCISAVNEQSLRRELSSLLECEESEILVRGDRTAQYRGNLICYEVEVPLKNIVAAAEFWGIDREDNKTAYKIKRCTTSEYLGR